MVHPAFDIRREDLAILPDDCKLLIEVSAQSFNYILFSRSPDQLFILRQYRIYTTTDKNTRDVLEEIISGDPVLIQYAYNAIIVYNFPESNLLPSEYFRTELKAPLTKLLYGDTENELIFDEHVHDWNMHNVYTVSKDLHTLCREKFKAGQYWHLYTMLLRSMSGRDLSGHKTKVIFYNDKFVVALFTDASLQLLQTFSYQTPEDAAYYLLLVCGQFDIKPDQIVLNISGLIDTQSALYAELVKYFADVRYDDVPTSYRTDGILQEYPSHYFSPLLKISLCV
jgi:hypothetical protein